MSISKSVRPQKKRLAKGLVSSNGSLIYEVRVRSGLHRGLVLTFTKHSEYRYTVLGFSGMPNVGLCIERRGRYDDYASMHDSGAQYRFREEDQWIAWKYSNRSFYGALAFGRTPEEAYERAVGHLLF